MKQKVSLFQKFTWVNLIFYIKSDLDYYEHNKRRFCFLIPCAFPLKIQETLTFVHGNERTIPKNPIPLRSAVSCNTFKNHKRSLCDIAHNSDLFKECESSNVETASPYVSFIIINYCINNNYFLMDFHQVKAAWINLIKKLFYSV